MACELDHVNPWSRGGGTNEDNLCALCERHHDLKEQHGWQVVLHDDRTVEWITPTGHRYRGHPVEHPIPPRPDPAPPDPPPPPPPQAEDRFVPAPPDVDDPPPF